MSRKEKPAPRRASSEDKIEAIDALIARGDAPKILEGLSEALKDPNATVVWHAAQIVSDLELRGLLPEIEAAFLRFAAKPAAADPGCLAKERLARDMVQFDGDNEEAFLAGLRLVQSEPVYGGRVDTADRLRAACAHGLAHMRHPDIFFLVAPLLLDPEHKTRQAAVRAIASVGGDCAELLLRQKFMAGDAEEYILGECLCGLMECNPERSLDFVAPHIDSSNSYLRESAELALGASAYPPAIEILIKAHEDSPESARKKELIGPLAMSRSERAFQFLLDIIENGPTDRAGEAFHETMAWFDADQGKRDLAQKAAQARDDSARVMKR
jgi:HEAT repeat protein